MAQSDLFGDLLFLLTVTTLPICKVPSCYFKDEATEDIISHCSNSALLITSLRETVLTMLQG